MTVGSNVQADLRLELIDDDERLEALAEPWHGLLASLEGQGPFVSHEWLCAWWRSFGAGRRLHLLVGWRGERLVGIAPLMLSQERRNHISVRRLGTLYNEHVQDVDFPVDEAERRAFLAALWQHLREPGQRWDLLEFCQFRRGSPVLAELERQADEAGMDQFYWEEGESPWVSLSGDWETYTASLSKSRRSEYRRQLKKLAERGETRLETVLGGEELDKALEDGLRLEALGWKGSAGTAILSDPALSNFYRELAQRSAARGTLRLYFLCVGTERIAFQYCLLQGRRLCLLKTAYDPAWRSHSPSQLLVWLVLEQAFKDGLREYDLLGDREEWKMVWARQTRPHLWFSVLGETLRGRLLGLVKQRLVPLARFSLALPRRGRALGRTKQEIGRKAG